MARRVKSENGGKVTAIYTRVSTDAQRDDSQAKALEDYIDAHGLGNTRWYRDKASGKDLKRPAFEKLQRDVFNGKVGTVLVWKLDRLARNIRDGINVLGDWLNKGIRVVAITQQLDLSGVVGQMVAAVLFGVGQMERENINERIRAGIRARKAKGLRMGRQKGQCPKWNLGKRKVDPALACSLRAQGVSVKDIAERFDCSKVAIYNALKAV